MGEAMETIPSTISSDIHTMRSKIRALGDIQASANDVVQISPAELDQLVRDAAISIQDQIDKALSDFSDIGLLPVGDFDGFLGRLKEELDIVEAESSKISANIDDLARTYFEDFSQLESELVELSCAVDSTASKGTEKANVDVLSGSPSHDKIDFSSFDGNCKFEILELNDQIERKKLDLETLQNLNSILKRFEAIEQFEDALTGLKVTEYELNWARVSLRTRIPISENFLFHHKLEESFEQLEKNHELLIEFAEGTLELKNVEMFPNDAYISDIIEAAKALWQFSSTLVPESRSSVEWLVRRVQDRIVLCTLRQLLMKNINKSRHSFEYLDRDEIVVAHMVGGVNAYIKMPLGWPVSDHPLKLVSLKSSDRNSKEISLSFLCKVEEMANSLDAHVRNNVTSFMDAIEEILMQQMRVELQS